MTDDEGPGESEADRDRSVWNQFRGWSKEHRRPLIGIGIGVTAAALGARWRGASSTGAVMTSTSAAATAAVEAAADASSRVAREFEALGHAYKMSAMDQTVRQAINRYQRWTPEELTVLRDTGKTALEKAFELQRTFNGVMAKSIKEGVSSKAP